MPLAEGRATVPSFFIKAMTGLDPHATIFNRVVAANIPVLANDISIADVAMLQVLVSENTGVTFSMRLTRGGVTRVLNFNAGVALVANSIYMFSVSVRPRDSINFQFGAATTIHLLNADRA